MLFYREVDNAHFFFNGDTPINVHPPAEQQPWEDRDAKCTELLVEVASNKRKKTFSIDKRRYAVITRGEFVTE